MTYFSSVEEYDVSTDSWIRKAPMPTPRSNFKAAAVDGKIYAIGGRTWGPIFISTVEEYDTGLVPSQEPQETGEPRSVAPEGKLFTLWGAVKRSQ